MKFFKLSGAIIIFVVMIIAIVLRPVRVADVGIDIELVTQEHYEAMRDLLLITTLSVLLVFVPIALYTKDTFAQYAYGGAIIAVLSFWVARTDVMVYIISGMTIFIIIADVTLNDARFNDDVNYAHRMEDAASKRIDAIKRKQKFRTKYINRGRNVSKNEWRKEREEARNSTRKERI